MCGGKGGILYCPTCLNPLLFPSFWKDSILFMCMYVSLWCVSMCLCLLLKHRKRVSSQMTRPPRKLLEKVHTEDDKEPKGSRPRRPRAGPCFSLHQLLFLDRVCLTTKLGGQMESLYIFTGEFLDLII